MVAETDFHQSIQILDVPRIQCSDLISVEISNDELDLRTTGANFDCSLQSTVNFVPCIRSGSYADIGPRRFMEDEHICIDDLASHLKTVFNCPTPSAFYGIFDGHGGPEAAAYIKRNTMRFFFEDVDFPQSLEINEIFLNEVESSIHKAFLLADRAIADDCTVSSSSGTTALNALIFGRLLLVANTGDCRAVLCRKGEAIEMSQDHKPIHTSERRRIEESGGYVEDGYLNGILSVSRALGDWDMKTPHSSTSPLIADPEFRQVILTEDDEFLIMGCDGIWDVMSSQHAVSVVRRGLRHHDNPDQSARELVMEALRLNTFDNLTVIIVCFSPLETRDVLGIKYSSFSVESLCNLKGFLDDVKSD